MGVGTPVLAPEDGVVIISANNVQDQYTGNPVSGETVVIRGTYEHWLLHNSTRLVKAGDRVKQGQVVAYSGNTGFTTGPHCHWGVRPLQPNVNNGYRGFIDPESVMKEGDMATPEQIDWAAIRMVRRRATPEDIKSMTGWPLDKVYEAYDRTDERQKINGKIEDYDHLYQTALSAQVAGKSAKDRLAEITAILKREEV